MASEKYTTEFISPEKILWTLLTKFPLWRISATIVKPPLVATFHERGPALRNWSSERSKVRCPLPWGPPVALYLGSGEDPTAALFLVDTDATEGLCIITAVNRSHAVFEYGPMKFPPVYPAPHGDGKDRHAVELVAAITSEYVPGVHAVHDVVDSVVEYVLFGHLVHVFEEVLDAESVQSATNPAN